MKKNILTSISATGLLVVALVVAVLYAMPATAADTLSVHCSTDVEDNVATWEASADGGIEPYVFAWSGHASVAGSASTTVVATYGENGTFVGTLQVTDASSTVATTSCRAVVSRFASTTQKIIKTDPSLSVSGRGRFDAQAMAVQSVASTSFMASVWGITYIINAPSSTVLTDYRAGHVVNVSGRVSTTSPMTVSATSVRNLTLAASTSRKGKPWRYSDESTGYAKTDHKDRGRGWKINLPSVFDWLRRDE